MDRPVPPAAPITLAVVAGAHGVTGEVRIKLFGEGVAGLKHHRAFNQAYPKKTEQLDTDVRQLPLRHDHSGRTDAGARSQL